MFPNIAVGPGPTEPGNNSEQLKGTADIMQGDGQMPEIVVGSQIPEGSNPVKG